MIAALILLAVVTLAAVAAAASAGLLLVRVLRQHDAERAAWGQERETLRAEHRGEIRELLNRYQFPQIMPTTRTQVPRAPRPDENHRDTVRRTWLGIGQASPLAAVPDDDEDELGSDVP